MGSEKRTHWENPLLYPCAAIRAKQHGSGCLQAWWLSPIPSIKQIRWDGTMASLIFYPSSLMAPGKGEGGQPWHPGSVAMCAQELSPLCTDYGAHVTIRQPKQA